MITTENDKFYRGAQFQAFFKNSNRSLVLKADAPHFTILAVSDTYLSLTHKRREQLLEKGLFEVFPDNPGDVDANGVANLYASLRTADQTGRPHEMAIQRYDIRDEAGLFVERHWRPINTPVMDDDGKVIALLHHVEEVTHAELSLSTGRPPDP